MVFSSLGVELTRLSNSRANRSRGLDLDRSAGPATKRLLHSLRSVVFATPVGLHAEADRVRILLVRPLLGPWRMTAILQTALAGLEREQRLLNPLLKGETRSPRRVGFQGDLVLKFRSEDQSQPELLCREVSTCGNAGAPTIAFFAGKLSSFAHLKDVASVLKGILKGGGKYFLFCDDLDSSSRYQVPQGGVMWYMLPTTTESVERELLNLLYIDQAEFGELGAVEQLDAVADAAAQFDITFDMMTYAEGVERLANG